MEQISKRKNKQTSSHRQQIISHKKKIRKYIALVTAFVLLLGGVGYFLYDRATKNTQNFYKEISLHDDNATTFKQEWTNIINKTKTPIQFLMVLKRLDGFGLTDEYRKTLAKALYKYRDIHSLIALATEYYMTYTDGIVFEPLLTETDVDKLWNEYPNLVRTFYIYLYKTKKTAYKGKDELLDMYYDIYNHHYSWFTLETLWKLTNEPSFLYLGSIEAEASNKKDKALALYNALPIEWLSIHTEYYIQLAWILRDTALLEPIVRTNKQLTEYIKLSVLYILENNGIKAFELLSEAKTLFPESSIKNKHFIHLYLWLATYHVNQKDIILSLIEPVQSIDNAEIQTTFLKYLYQYDEEMYKEYTLAYPNIEALQTYPPFAFFTLNRENASILQKKVFLWNLIHSIDDKESDEYIRWAKIAASFFLSTKLLDDFVLLYETSTSIVTQKHLFPFYLYFILNFTDNELTDIDTNNIKQYNEQQVQKPWWFYYNIGLWNLNKHNYIQAQYEFEKAIETIEEQFTATYKQYPLAQLVRVYLALNQIEQAEITFKELKTLFNINPIILNLESNIEQIQNNNIPTE